MGWHKIKNGKLLFTGKMKRKRVEGKAEMIVADKWFDFVALDEDWETKYQCNIYRRWQKCYLDETKTNDDEECIYC